MAIPDSDLEQRMNPAEVFPPGDFLREELEERGWSVETVAQKGLVEPAMIEGILANKRRITRLAAYALAWALDTTPEVWLALQAAWDNRQEITNMEATP